MSAPFKPYPDRASVNLPVTATSASVEVRESANAGFEHSVRVNNSGANRVFIRFGTSSITATSAAGLAMEANSVETFSLPREVTHIAAIAADTGNTLNITLGGGA